MNNKIIKKKKKHPQILGLIPAPITLLQAHPVGWVR
jgi:hypothetical protein